LTAIVMEAASLAPPNSWRRFRVSLPLFEYAVHVGLDMTGAITFACIMGACKNPTHNHGRVLGYIGSHPWQAQMVAAVIIGVIAVHTIG